ncbi:tRNA ligase class II core domain protein [Dictyocaulus viviparus]|uniref:proline--tRNA ligase n=1 Tax=Dictyocaulus viviparus TaxID=29172 RepID=A0A0D8XNH0_DICVI|nr:tRNA ligase class II core domain protein [Dictyocaulus viviparus]
MVVFKASKYILTGRSSRTTKSNAHRLLLNHGFIHPFYIYLLYFSLLPLGQRVIDKLVRLVDTELESIGALKVNMPILGPRMLWDKTSRWQNMGSELFSFKDRNEVEFCLQPTAEEMCTQLISTLPHLKKRMFPLLLYQITEKFRDEMNPRFGLLRARQFLMKDLYSFDLNGNDATITYNMVLAKPGIHGEFLSHEYHLKSPLDEDGINFCLQCGFGNKREDDVHKSNCSGSCSVSTFSTVEVAHTFQLGTKYSCPLRALTPDNCPVEMCCFGIGISRLLPAIAELLSDSERLRLPSIIAPFSTAVVVTRPLQRDVITEMVLSTIDQRDGDVLFDDRVEDTVGKRVKALQRIGIPRIVVIGKTTQNTMNKVPKFEYIESQEDFNATWESQELSLNEMMQIMK